MFDIPMKSSGALSLSELDSNKFAKGSAQQAAPNPIPAQDQGGFGGQPTGGFGQQPASGFGAPADFGAQPTQAQGFSQPAGGFAPQPAGGFGQPTGGFEQQSAGGYVQQPQQNIMPQTTGFAPQPAGGFSQPQPAGGFSQPQPQVQQQVKQRPAGGGVIIKKGQKTSLSQMNPALDLIEVGLGWDLGPNGQSYDLDVEAFLLGQSGRVIGDDWFVFYNQPSSPDGSVRLLSDSTTGAGVGDDEIIQVRLSQVNNQVQKIAFIVTINEAKENGYNFSNVTNAYVRIVDKQTGKELIKFQLTEYYNTVCSMVIGELYRHNGEWKFSPIGDGTADDLTGLCVRYGVNIAG